MHPNFHELSREEILQEILARGNAFNLQQFCFPKQLAFLEDSARFKTACCSRRAGKTIGCAAHLIDTAISEPGVACLYTTLTRQQAKRIIWEPLKQLNEQFNLGGVPHETDLTLKFPNRSVIYLSGAKDKEEVKKYLGYPLKLVYIDEAQSFRPYLKELVDEALAPTLIDYAGTVVLMGTPGPVPVGYFYELCHGKTWSNHVWTLLDNPHLRAKSGKDPLQLVMDECTRREVPIDDPGIQRQFFGKWVMDSNALVFRWQAQNDYQALPVAKSWQYVLGIDLGYADADAIAVLGWNESGAETYLVEELVRKKQGITELADQIAELIKRYEPVSVVMDTGGLGKKIAEELQVRYNLPIKPAEKTEKFSHIELVNDALRTRQLFAKKESQFVQDSFLLEWDRDKSNGDKLVVSDAFHSDITDAVLYAFREAGHWLHTPAAPKPALGTPAWYQAEVEKMEEAARKQLERELNPDESMWDDMEAVGW